MSSDFFGTTFKVPNPLPRAPDLSKFTTRDLLAELRYAYLRAMPGEQQIEKMHWDRDKAGLPWMWEWDKAHFEKNATVKIWGLNGGEFTVAEVKAELATREHVPNKQEAKEIRRARAKRGRNRGRRDR